MKAKVMTICLVVTIILALTCAVQAGMLTFTLTEVEDDVVGTVSGTLNTSALTQNIINYSDSGLMIPTIGVVAVGPQHSLTMWIGLEGEVSSFGPGQFVGANFGTGDTVGINLSEKTVFISPSYISESVLSGSSIWYDNSFASLNITPARTQ